MVYIVYCSSIWKPIIVMLKSELYFMFCPPKTFFVCGGYICTYLIIKILQWKLNTCFVRLFVCKSILYSGLYYLTSKNGCNTRSPTKEKPLMIMMMNCEIFAKMAIGWAKYLYVCKWDMLWRKVCVVSLVTENVKSRSNISLSSSDGGHFEIWFPK